MNVLGAFIWLGGAASVAIAPQATYIFIAAMVAMLLLITLRRSS